MSLMVQTRIRQGLNAREAGAGEQVNKLIFPIPAKPKVFHETGGEPGIFIKLIAVYPFLHLRGYVDLESLKYDAARAVRARGISYDTMTGRGPDLDVIPGDE